MRLVVVSAVLLGCNDPGFDGVSIRPTYGWEDGCTAVTVGGHGFDEGVTGSLDGNALTGIALPDPAEEEMSVGFKFTAVTPPHAPGFTDLTVTNGDGEDATVANAFYYIACAGTPTVDSVSADSAVGGEEIVMSGCGFAEGMAIDVVAPDDLGTPLASVPLTLTCSTAIAQFTAPTLPIGSYLLLVTDGAGTVLYGANLCDTADSGYYGCDVPLVLTYGGGT